MRLAVVGVYVKFDNVGSVLRDILRYNWVGAGTVTFVRYCRVESKTVVLGVSGDDGKSVFCSIPHYHWVGYGTVEFFRYHIIGSGTVVLGVSGYGVAFDASVWKARPSFLVAGS